MMKKTLKIISLFIIAVTIFVCFGNNVIAGSLQASASFTPTGPCTFQCMSDSSGNCVGGGGGGSGYEVECVEGLNKVCAIQEEPVKEDMILKEDVYDTKGNYLGSALVIKDKYRFVAGRFIGIDAYEKYTKTFEVSITALCKIGHIEYITIYWVDTCEGVDLYGNHVSQSCTKSEDVPIVVCTPCSFPISECRPTADKKLEELANSVEVESSFIAKRQDVNDIKSGLDGEEPTIPIAISSETIDRGHSEPSDQNSSHVTRTVTYEATYNLTPAWINPKTGRVKYEQDTISTLSLTTADKTKNSYMKVKPDLYTTRLGEQIRIGKYFVPLNAKSTDLLRYYLNPNMSRDPLKEKLCTNLIEKYSVRNDEKEHWTDFLADKNGVPLKNRASTVNEAINIVKREHGCRLSLRVDFRIAQGFYNEVPTTGGGGTGGSGGGSGIGGGIGGSGGTGSGSSGSSKISLKGYNFYYRPIDYKTPFPNGLTDNSYWIEVYDKKNNAVTIENASGNKLDLDDSFGSVTYATNKDYNLEVIRTYNSKEDNKYTSMAKMTISGTSNFISDAYGVTRYDCQTYYALGCGPSNSDWEECKIRQTGVCKR